MVKLLRGKIVLKCLHEFFKIKSNMGGDSSNDQGNFYFIQIWRNN